jgi:hypothetical protein
MLSVGAVAYDDDGAVLGEYTANLKPLVGARPDPTTMAFWQDNAAAHRAATSNAQPAGAVLNDFREWTQSFGSGRRVFVAAPAAFDYMFVYWYFQHFQRRSPFRFDVIDLRSFAMGVLGRSYTDSAAHVVPLEWQSKRPHTHVALDDAREQGDLFVATLRAAREGQRIRTSTTALLEQYRAWGMVTTDDTDTIDLLQRIDRFYGTKPPMKRDRDSTP